MLSETQSKGKYTLIAAGVVSLLVSAVFFLEAIINPERRYVALLLAIVFLVGGVRGLMRDRGAGFFMAEAAFVLILYAAIPLVMVIGNWSMGKSASALLASLGVEYLFYPAAGIVMVLLVVIGSFRNRAKDTGRFD